MMSRVWSFFTLTVVSAFMLSACSQQSIPELSEDSASTENVVLAIRFSSQEGGGGGMLSREEGGVLLVDKDGSANMVDVGPMDNGLLLWDSDNLFLSTVEDEIAINDSGLTRFSRGATAGYEVGRYPSESNDGFKAFYSREGGQQVVVGNGDGVSEVVDNTGAYMVNGYCGDRVLSLTTTHLVPELTGTASSLIPEQLDHTSSEGVPTYDVITQVYPHTGDVPPILGVTKSDKSIESGQKYFSCFNNSIYILSFQKTFPNASRDNDEDPTAGRAVFDVWDLETGGRSTVPILDSEGYPVDVSTEDISVAEGLLDGPIYTFATNSGKVFSVDVRTGLIENQFRIELTDPENRSSRFSITKDYIFALDVPQDKNKELTLSKYAIATGEHNDLFSIKGTGKYLKDNFLTGSVRPQSIAIRPEFVDDQE